MLVIGEKINASRGEVKEALKRRDKRCLQDLAKRQAEAGADFIDVNVGVGRGEEPGLMEWAVETIQEATGKPLALDTTDSDVLQAGLAKCKGKALVNSINGEEGRLTSFLPLIEKHGSSCIALATDERGIPKKPSERVKICERISKEAGRYGIGLDRIYFDPAVIPLSADPNAGSVVLETLRLIKLQIPGAKTTLGLSNISYGLPERRLLHQVFLSMALAQGVDSIILDLLDKRLIAVLNASYALIGQDRGCRRYLKAYRRGELD